MRYSYSLLALVFVLTLTGCGATPSTLTPDEEAALRVQVDATVADFRRTDPSMERFFKSAYAMAVFPNVTEGGALVGGGRGHGEVFKDQKLVGYADVTKFSVGAQLGGMKFDQIIFFQSVGSYTEFVNSTLEFDAQAKAVAAKSGAAAVADYERGVAVFTLTKGGLMAQAAIGGQKFRFMPLRGSDRGIGVLRAP